MNRGRAAGRGTRRGAATAGARSTAEAGDSSTPSGVTDTAGASTTPGPGTSARSTPSVSVRGAPSTRATRGPSVARFRPKNVRRDEAERDSLARQEEQKASERAAEERRARGRSRFRSKRSRGDAMGARGGMNRNIAGASGPFAAGAGGASRSGGWFGGGGSGGGGFRGSGSFSRSFKSESKPGFANADSSRNREKRINADRLNIVAPEEEFDSEDEAMMETLSSRPVSVLPMGIYRREHKDEGVVVATTAELEAAENATGQEESLWVDGDGAGPTTVEDPPEDGVWTTDSKKPVVIKTEPGLEDTMDLDVDIKAAKEDPEVEPAAATKPKKAIPQDLEEKMIQSDLELLAGELGSITITEDGETKTEGPANKDGRMYLFQFPPLLPPLRQVAVPQTGSKVKAEPQNSSMVDLASIEHTTPVDLTAEDANQNADDEDEEQEPDPEDTAGFMSSLLSQGGMVGKLNVRKSGKVELDWGGRILEMSPAAGMNFLSTAVIVEENDEKPKAGVVGGESIGMGKIMGRFVLAPTWGEEEDWDVSPEELKID